MTAARRSRRAAADAAHIAPGLRPLAVPVATLRSDGGNVRRHDDRNLAAITASLQRFGQQKPVLYSARGAQRIVIAGNGVLQAARRLGWKTLAAVESSLQGPEATAYAIADNRTTDLSDFDERLLAAQLQDLEQLHEVDLAAMGFSEEEMQDLLADLEKPPRSADGDEPESDRRRGERVAVFVIGHLKFELPRKKFDGWISGLEAKVGNDPDRIIAEVKRRLKLPVA